MYEGHSIHQVNFSIKIFLVEIKVYFLLFSFLGIRCKLHVVCVLIAFCFASNFTEWLTRKVAQGLNKDQ